MSNLLPDNDVNILVIGAGVSGLTTAICLREVGFRVVIVADRFAPDLTSIVAGALWEWPPAVCGSHGAPRSLERSKDWCMTTYNKFKKIHAEFGSEETGLYLKDAYFYFKDVLENRPTELRKMNELKDKVDGFERGLQIVKETIDLSFKGGIKDAYKHMAPTTNTDVYMKWLLQQVKDIGCEIIQEKITVNVVQNEQELLRRFNAKAIVNCAGLGSIATTGDTSMYPLRGALVRVKNLGGVVTDAHCISHEESSLNEQDIVYIVPRGDDLVVLGGLTQQDQWDTDLSLEVPIIRQMYDGCLEFLQELRELPLDEKEPVRTGLRPLTEENVCVERVLNTHVFYNYGHGGSGVTLSWGCSQEIVQLVQEMLREEANPVALHSSKIDSNKQTVFVLHDMLASKTDFRHIRSDNRNLGLLCSREGLSKVVPSQYQHLDLVRIVEPYNLQNLLQTYQQIKTEYKLLDDNCRIVTNDEYSVLLAAQLREALNLAGDRPTMIRQFTDKSYLKSTLKNSLIRVPKYLIFAQNQYRKEPVSYLKFVLEELGNHIFIKPVTGAGSEKTRRIHTVDELKAWCDSNVDSDEEFEFNEFITGQLYNTSVVIKNGQPCYFAACKQYRPNDEFIYGHQIGNIIVREEDPEFHKLWQFSSDTLQSLEHGYPKNGVLNIDLFLQEGSEEPILMEVAARPPGGLVSRMFDIYQGVRLNELHLQLQIGDSPDIILKDRFEWKYSASSIHPKQDGIVTAIEKPILESDVEISWQIYLEQRLKGSQSTRDVAIAILLSNHDYSTLQGDYEVANSTNFYNIK
ncbi:FAD-dependent oxidoreductase [Nostoc sp. UHCC 0926]|uniref:FAD-dependent oxidoreductase n=1 Tax=unclassified Nostoc TaxID=2593658 RepID=UPI0023627C81|nr:FAD-dependent oxidoreductase [Nostoc sp. UHCC 0926]WDD31187.1 FAD-dependent oxidoreductase [Nostoc sp. UHCC 0926]